MPSCKPRSVIETIPDGERFFADLADEDAPDGLPCRIAVTMTVKGSEIVLALAAFPCMTARWLGREFRFPEEHAHRADRVGDSGRDAGVRAGGRQGRCRRASRRKWRCPDVQGDRAQFGRDRAHPRLFPVGSLGVLGGMPRAFTVRFGGQGGHGGSGPHLSIDPTLAMSQFITNLQTIIGRNVWAMDQAVGSVGPVSCVSYASPTSFRRRSLCAARRAASQRRRAT